MSNGLSEEELKEFREIFNLVDTNQKGYITVQELRKLMETLHLKPTEEELEEMFHITAHKNSDDTVNFEQFANILGKRVRSDYTPEQLRNAFKVFESEDMPPGCVSTEILQYALMNYSSEKLSKEEVNRLIAAVDPENTGSINYNEFVNMVSGN